MKENTISEKSKPTVSNGMEIISHSPEETEKLAAQFVEKLLREKSEKKAMVVALRGDLGTGKTAFTKGVAKALGVTETVTSPTFIIQKSYTLASSAFHKLIHIDAYRFEEATEAHVLELETLFKNPHYLIVIEWPEQIEPFIPADAIRVHFTFIDGSTRKITHG